MSTPYACREEDAARIHDWLVNRGGILIWRSANLSNPGASWTTPAQDANGGPYEKPNWQCASQPEKHILNIDDVIVYTPTEVKRFHVATRMSGNGLSIKVTDGGSRRLRTEVAKAHQKFGQFAWHVFDYDSYENARIMIESERKPMADWVAKHKETTCTC
ncbi:MAG: hypothetical protein WCT04_06235 [Planctomycetota bacterium]